MINGRKLCSCAFLLIFTVACSSPSQVAEVVFDGPIYAAGSGDSVYFTVSVKNIGTVTAHDVVATIAVHRGEMILGLYEVGFDDVHPGCCESRPQRVAHVEFGDDIRVKGTLRWR